MLYHVILPQPPHYHPPPPVPPPPLPLQEIERKGADASCKSLFVLALLDQLAANGHRTLIFSQSRVMLDILEVRGVAQGEGEGGEGDRGARHPHLQPVTRDAGHPGGVG